jgi:hypothetical protein
VAPPGPLLKIAALSAFAAVGLGLAQVSIEIIGVGARAVPVPTTVVGWFELLHEQRLLAFTALTGLQIPMFALIVVVLFGLRLAVSESNRPIGDLAALLGIVGSAVYLASNSAFALTDLSDKYFATTAAADRSALLAAGEAALADYSGAGLDVGVPLVMLSIAGFAGLMLRREVGPRLGPASGALGLLVCAVTVSYHLAVPLGEARIYLLELAGVLLLAWLALVGRGLLAQSAERS